MFLEELRIVIFSTLVAFFLPMAMLGGFVTAIHILDIIGIVPPCPPTEIKK
jgi:hypothetical protein